MIAGIIAAAVLALAAMASPAYADHAIAEVSIPEGTSITGCEELSKCYVPRSVSIDEGGEVHWFNDDIAAHTVTSGDGASEAVDGMFDSGFIAAGQVFSFSFESAGKFPYFCTIHPWMVGTVTVQAFGEDVPRTMSADESRAPAAAKSTEDGTHMVSIYPDTAVEAGAKYTFTVGITDSDGSPVEYANYDVKVQQDGQAIFTQNDAHSQTGTTSFTTPSLESGEAPDIIIMLNGFGPRSQEERTGPSNEALVFNAVTYGEAMMDKDAMGGTDDGGGCLIATAAYGTELAPQVQQLREVRDGVLLKTGAGSSFMSAFNSAYYAFSPAVADLERQSPAFKEMTRAAITPMIASLSVMQGADTEAEVVAYGIGAILLNIGMYFGAPAAAIIVLNKRRQS